MSCEGDKTLEEVMTDDYREICIRSITSSSTDYARYYIKKADIEMLEECLRRIEGRGQVKTLRRLIESRLRRLRRKTDV